jgi:hypothetical protein
MYIKLFCHRISCSELKKDDNKCNNFLLKYQRYYANNAVSVCANWFEL